jgi:hypothetical protein
MHMLQRLFYLTIVLHVSGIIVTHLQEHKTNLTTASGNRYTVIDRVKFLLLKSTYRLNIYIYIYIYIYQSFFYRTYCIFRRIYIIKSNCNFNQIYRYYLTEKFKSVYYSVTVTRCCSYSCFVLLKVGDSDTWNM